MSASARIMTVSLELQSVPLAYPLISHCLLLFYPWEGALRKIIIYKLSEPCKFHELLESYEPPCSFRKEYFNTINAATQQKGCSDSLPLKSNLDKLIIL